MPLPASARAASRRDPNQRRWLSPALLLVWESFCRLGIPAHTLAAPSSVGSTLAQMIGSGDLPINLAVSLRRAILGLIIGATVGVALALAAGLARRGDGWIDPLVQVKPSA